MSLQFEIKDYGIIVKKTDATGIVQSKIVDPEDVARALANKVKMDTGILPRNTRLFSRHSGGCMLVIELPEHIRRIEHSLLNTAFDIPMPYTCFIINCSESENEITTFNVKLFALHGPIVDSNTIVYRFPFGNVYHPGNVCMGSVSYPIVNRLAELSIIPEIILSSKFNGDLSSDAFTAFDDPSNKDIRIFRCEHLLNYLNGSKSFPYQILIPSGNIGNHINKE